MLEKSLELWRIQAFSIHEMPEKPNKALQNLPSLAYRLLRIRAGCTLVGLMSAMLWTLIPWCLKSFLISFVSARTFTAEDGGEDNTRVILIEFIFQYKILDICNHSLGDKNRSYSLGMNLMSCIQCQCFVVDRVWDKETRDVGSKYTVLWKITGGGARCK